MRPFVLGAKVSPLGCSRPLQRAIVDFAADQPFAQTRAKLQEHYGFAIGESTIQRITFAHNQAMSEAGREDIEFPEAPGLSKPIIVQTDGGMVPIVEPSCEGKDKRKGKRLSWREAKLSLAQTGLKTWPSCVASLLISSEPTRPREASRPSVRPQDGIPPSSSKSCNNKLLTWIPRRVTLPPGALTRISKKPTIADGAR